MKEALEMNSIREIIEARGGWDRLKAQPIKVEVGEGFMPLCVEYVGLGAGAGGAFWGKMVAIVPPRG